MRRNERNINDYATYELKAVDFKPEFAGKMNFYLSAVDDRMKHPTDNPFVKTFDWKNGLCFELCAKKDRDFVR